MHMQLPTSHNPFFLDHLYANEWLSTKAATETEPYYADEQQQNGARYSQILHVQAVPKLEDFLGAGRDSSTLTQIYHPPNSVASNYVVSVAPSAYAPPIDLPCSESQSGDGALSFTAVVGKKPDSFGQRTSIYRGVTRHRWTGRYEAHLWDNSCRREGQARKGRQVVILIHLVKSVISTWALFQQNPVLIQIWGEFMVPKKPSDNNKVWEVKQNISRID
ncbi:hypothetical protein V2J09_016502 [Rumex salicifolius]